MKWHQAVWVLGLAGGLGLVVACGDDDDTPGSNAGGSAGKGGSNDEGGKAGSGGKSQGGSAGKAGNESVGGGGDGGTGGAAECPADLANADGKACGVDGQQCLDPAEPCEHNYSVECVDGVWENLVGLAAPCGGAGGGGAGGRVWGDLG